MLQHPRIMNTMVTRLARDSAESPVRPWPMGQPPASMPPAPMIRPPDSCWTMTFARGALQENSWAFLALRNAPRGTPARSATLQSHPRPAVTDAMRAAEGAVNEIPVAAPAVSVDTYQPDTMIIPSIIP